MGGGKGKGSNKGKELGSKAIQRKSTTMIEIVLGGGGNNPLQRQSLQKHTKKVESFGHEHVMVEGGRMGKGKGKGKEKGKEKRKDLMCVNTNGLLEVQKKGGDGVELRKPSGNIIPPPSMVPPPRVEARRGGVIAPKSKRESFVPPHLQRLLPFLVIQQSHFSRGLKCSTQKQTRTTTSTPKTRRGTRGISLMITLSRGGS